METKIGVASVIETIDRERLIKVQLEKLELMLSSVLNNNALYRRKLNEAGLFEADGLTNLDEYQQLPFTTKDELSKDQTDHPPYGTNLTFPKSQYVRIHQTSGTSGMPMRWLDTAESWNWWLRCWETVYRGADVNRSDRIFFAFSFGPFIGFWTAYEAAAKLGALTIPGGGMTSLQRLRAIQFNDISVLICTPTYALHLAEVAQLEGIDIATLNVRTTIHAGEPGASIPSTKHRIENAWGANCYDHVGATEVGAWGFECQAQAGVHLNESEFICEVVNPVTGRSAEEGELVITNLGRIGMPVLRYRTGDYVRLQTDLCECGRTFFRAEDGVIGRVDEAMIIRGVNVYPSTVENIVRRFPQVVEFAVDIYRRGALDEMEVKLEISSADANDVAADLIKDVHEVLGLRVSVTVVDSGTLPRFELKAKRFADHR